MPRCRAAVREACNAANSLPRRPSKDLSANVLTKTRVCARACACMHVWEEIRFKWKQNVSFPNAKPRAFSLPLKLRWSELLFSLGIDPACFLSPTYYRVTMLETIGTSFLICSVQSWGLTACYSVLVLNLLGSAYFLELRVSFYYLFIYVGIPQNSIRYSAQKSGNLVSGQC